MRHVVIGTAGHIDHGKTALVQALTGVDTDRLPEEKRRGITIELGFAPWLLAPDLHASIVDVPGHERLVHTMVAGATGIDLALLCVAANDGVMPQTREHLDVLALLGIRRGILVLTKCDLADPEVLALVEADVRDAVAGTVFEEAPLVRTSSRTRAGLDELQQAALAECSAIAERDASGPAFLPLDRVFQKHGFGTVVTGTLARGALAAGDLVSAWGERNDGSGIRGLKVRGLQNSHRACERAGAGMRVAVNLSGREVEMLGRGMVLTNSAASPLSSACVANVRVLRHAAPLGNEEITIHLGTSERLARVLPLGGTHLAPGSQGSILIKLASPVAAFAGQRLILRRAGLARGATIAGGEILDPQPPASKGAPRLLATLSAQLGAGGEGRIEAMALAARADGLGAGDVAWRIPPAEPASALAGMLASGKLIEIGDRYVHARFVDDAEREILDILGHHGREHPLAAGLPEAELSTRLAPPVRPLVARALGRAASRGLVVSSEGLVRLAGRSVAATEAVAPEAASLLAFYRDQGFTPPSDDEAVGSLGLAPKRMQELLAALRREGRLVKVATGLHYDASAVEEITGRVVKALSARPELSAADFKDMLGGISRKWAIPLLEYLDQKHVTVRVGNVRRLHPSRRQNTPG